MGRNHVFDLVKLLLIGSRAHWAEKIDTQKFTRIFFDMIMWMAPNQYLRI